MMYLSLHKVLYCVVCTISFSILAFRLWFSIIQKQLQTLHITFPNKKPRNVFQIRKNMGNNIKKAMYLRILCVRKCIALFHYLFFLFRIFCGLTPILFLNNFEKPAKSLNPVACATLLTLNEYLLKSISARLIRKSK